MSSMLLLKYERATDNLISWLVRNGGLVLTNQEIRNAMTQSAIREFLEELAEDQYLKKSIGDQSKHMVDQELVLRFLAVFQKLYF